MNRNLPNWRSLLYVPASAGKFVAKAHERGDRAVILDLEDGDAPWCEVCLSAPACRPRPPACGAMARMCWCASTARLRIAAQDIAAAVAAGADALFCTKVMGPDHVRLLSGK